MSGFNDFYGQSGVIGHIKNAINMNKISHAYIINGEAGMGKKMMAKTFAMTLQCEKQKDEPCMECRSCKQTLTMNQPDIKWVTHEKIGLISVDEIREQVNSDIQIKPYSSKYKIYIIDEAEKMNDAAQNALLKTIEEPPVYGIIILLTTNSNMLLSTILSRCVELNLRPVKDDIIKRYLMEKSHVPDYQADMAVAFSGGNLGKAIKMATSSEFEELKNNVLQLVRNISSMTVAQMADLIKTAEKNKDGIDEYLDVLRNWYRDVLIYKATGDEKGVIFKEEMPHIRKQARQLSYESIENIVSAIDKVKIRLKSNVNFEMVIEILYLTMREGFVRNDKN